MTFADDFDLGSRLARTMPDVVAIWGGIGVTLVVILFVGIWLSKKASYEKAARLYTFSSAFWARWQGERLWTAPYHELAAEAARCEQILGGMGFLPPQYESKDSTPSTKTDDANAADRRIDREGASFRAKRGAVLRAMSHAVSQGRGPQAPP